MTEEKNLHGALEIKDRKQVRVSGVNSVVGFGEDYVALETTLGRLVIEGEGMKIENLSKDDGSVDISGKIFTAAYSSEKVRSGFLSRFVSK